MLTFRQTHTEEELRPGLKESARARDSAVGCSRQAGMAAEAEGRARGVPAGHATPELPVVDLGPRPPPSDGHPRVRELTETSAV